jgi:hypothetical protein
MIMGSSGSEKDYDKEGSRNTTKESGGRTQDKQQWKEALEPLIAIAKKIPGVELIILVLTFISKLIGWKGLLGAFIGDRIRRTQAPSKIVQLIE